MAIKNNHADEVSVLLKTVLESPGETEPALRERILKCKDIPVPLNEFTAKVRNESYRITTADIKKLISAGCSEDAIFEVTIIAALGAAKRVLDAGLKALEEVENEA